jgi:hypothetical protein
VAVDPEFKPQYCKKKKKKTSQVNNLCLIQLRDGLRVGAGNPGPSTEGDPCCLSLVSEDHRLGNLQREDSWFLLMNLEAGTKVKVVASGEGW